MSSVPVTVDDGSRCEPRQTLQPHPRFTDEVYNERRRHSAPGCLSPNRFEDRNARNPVKTAE